MQNGTIHKEWQYAEKGQAVILCKGVHFIFCICCTLLTGRVPECSSYMLDCFLYLWCVGNRRICVSWMLPLGSFTVIGRTCS